MTLEGHITVEEKTRIPSLRRWVFLYSDSSVASDQMREILTREGITFWEAFDGPIEPFEKKPLILYMGGTHEGVEGLKDFLDELRHWAIVMPSSSEFGPPPQPVGCNH